MARKDSSGSWCSGEGRLSISELMSEELFPLLALCELGKDGVNMIRDWSLLSR